MEEYIEELKRWPWLDNWHAAHMNGVWEQVVAYRALLEESADVGSNRALWQASLSSRPKSRKLFVGAVEFYDI